ncbi:hypothetical protein CCUS01_14726 [Colletotrichum cuscutae]|uniref:Arylamine N-acetyltransferase n=1 Tax=Colletotrichum cuscutae TaxID=1209917 RepID=A0AAI9VHG8_9PEZI|nr:hypothetical protein CCUS01_14726 [Colletotrichum cuscutae]
MTELSKSAYNQEQVALFEELICLPTKYRQCNRPVRNLAYLTALHVHTISTIPYENLSLHYSESRLVELDPQLLFEKLVTGGRGRGGYCMEVSILMNHVLRTLGFQAYMTGVRIRLRKNGVPSGDYIGHTHMVSLVGLPDKTQYMIDVAFGGDGATKPIPLKHDQVLRNLGTQEVRLVRGHIPNQVFRTEASKLWIYQYRNGPAKEWNSFYAFSEQEFLEPDFKVMNWYTSTSPHSFQRFCPLVVKFLRKRETLNDGAKDDGEIVGKRMLVGSILKENMGGKTRVVKDCQDESDRVKALEEWFGIRLTTGEMAGIKGHWTEIGRKTANSSAP